MSFEHPYPDYAYLDVNHETTEKRWSGTKGMGVRYVHEDLVAEMVEAAVAAEREACAKIIEDGQETFSNTREEQRSYLTPRAKGNLAGLAYAEAIRSATPIKTSPKK